MDKNKKHIDAEEFFKLMDADSNQDLSHLDDFDKEALEGLKMIKDRSKLENVNARVDAKLEELIANEKKGKSRTGLYFLSIAASIALIIGLFIVFQKSDLKNELAISKEVEGKDQSPPPASAAADIDKKLEQVSSDAQVVTEDRKTEPDAEKTPIELQQKITGPGYLNGQGVVDQKYEAIPPPAEKEVNLESKVNDKYVGDVDYNTAKFDELKKQDDAKVVQEETNKSLPSLSNTVEVAANNGAVNYSYSTPNNTTTNSNTAFTTAIPVNKETAEKNIAVKGKKKEAKNYKAAEVAPSYTETKSTLTTPTTGGIVTGRAETIADNISTADETVNTPKVVEAEFVGGKAALDEYIKKNLQVPASCASEEIIIIRVMIDEAGNVTKPKILSKTGNCSDCEKEAIRFVKAMPAWIAATADGKTFTSQKTLTLSFKK